MATAPTPPSPKNTGGGHRTVITITACVAILAVIVLLTLYGKSRSPLRRLDELQLQAELQRSGHRRRRKQPQERGIAPSLLQFIPAIKYNVPSPGERRSKSLDLENGHVDGEAQAWSFAQSQQSIKAMQVGMSEIEKGIHRRERDGAYGKLMPEPVQQECPICTQPFVQNEYIRILPCRHMHHRSCVDRWLLGFSRTCPVCRVDMDSFHLESAIVPDLPQKPEAAVVNGEKLRTSPP